VCSSDLVWKFDLGEGKPAASFGFLAQPQAEWLGQPDGTTVSHNLFFRRLRLMAGGKISSKLAFLIDSDSCNLGKKATDGKRTTDSFVQDAFITYSLRPEFQIDGGMLLVPISHNTQQSAASLLPVDSGAYSFLASAPTNSKNGRDYGLQARGYIKKHFEYRLGAFRGHRNNDAGFPFRYTGRFVWYPFDADTGFFYTGTSLGQKRIFGIGTSFDRQAHYSSNAVDLFIDQPFKNGDAATCQIDVIHYNGATTFASLPKQNALLIEAGYYFHRAKIGPFFQMASRDFSNPDSSDEKKVQGGIAYWAKGHRMNVKLGLGRLLKNGSPERMQLVIQTQIFCY
jgi:hypothetical protein